jgi:aminoglycoside-2''-adenylyltransferase
MGGWGVDALLGRQTRGTARSPPWWTVPYAVTAEALRGHGVLAGQRVRCITADMQRRAHTGHEFPPHDAADMELLAGLS